MKALVVVLAAAWIGLGAFGVATDWEFVRSSETEETGVPAAPGAGAPEATATASPDEDEIRRAVTDDLLVGDPAHCTELETSRLVQQLTDGTPAEALEECREDEKEAEDMGIDVLITELVVRGDAAEVRAQAVGGSQEPYTLRIELVRDSGDWKLDHISDVAVDRRLFDRELRASAKKQELTKQETDCAVARINRIPTRRIEQTAFLGGQRERDLQADPVLLLAGDS